ncbi:CheR family methyltransferase [Sulfurimonas sp.]|uniref:CheR family methyltransferase n=1 Tax=Sulfurimonas sp. TaxID=2022749 RepID=UPI0035622754
MKKKTYINFPIVGIGASAGGLGAFESFFSSLPTNIEIPMSFVLVQHLAPDHESILSEIMRRYTDMTVLDVKNNMHVLPNHIYIIPPNYDMALTNGKFVLTKPLKERGHRLPIDFFFSSLANEMQNMAIAVVLSGGGRDGSLGIKDIKRKGGLVIAQKADSAEFDSMPINAIETGVVDYELLTQEMGAKIIEHIKNAISNKEFPKKDEETPLDKVFFILNKNLGYDFSMYKKSTIDRRIQKRMDLHKVKSLKSYVDILSENKDEVIALSKEILIGVTNFFRDPKAFKSLELNVIPKIFTNGEGKTTIRVWIAGCYTGEEAYSIAILLKEYMTKHNISKTVQIFASDIDTVAISTARKGIFSESITENVSGQRLKDFFSKRSDNSYLINKNIRDMIIFSVHDVIKDPPFSKLDLISCRNLMIYMTLELQKKLIKLFHYSLNQNGFLFLGASESIGDLDELFVGVDKKHKIFQSKLSIQTAYRTISMTEQKKSTIDKKDTPLNKQELPLKELVEQAILQKISPVAVLVKENGDILYLHGKTGSFLEMPQGNIGVNNIFTMVEESIKTELFSALKKVKTDKAPVNCNNLNVKINGRYENININVSHISTPITLKAALSNYYLIIFEKNTMQSSSVGNDTVSKTVNLSDKEQRLDDLRRELEIQEKFLQAANERQELSNQELKSFNEEMQSLNEELQSTNEELETSREELQSVNEELSTVNSELQTKITDLTRANNDMNNLISGTSIGTVFVDHNLNILRFTPEINKIINLIKGDIGRPIRDIVTNFIDYKDLLVDVQSVLDTLIPIEHEVKTIDELSFLLRIQPYRTVDNIIEGAVVSFTDITDLVETREKLKEIQSKTYLYNIVYDSRDAIIMHDLDGKIIAWNPSAYKLYGWSEEEAVNMNIRSIIPSELVDADLKKRREIAESSTIQPYTTKRIAKNGDIINVMITSTLLIDKDSNVYAISTTERCLDI